MRRAVAPPTGTTSWNRSEKERTYSSEELKGIFQTLGKVSTSTSAARFGDSLGLFPREADGPRHVEEKVAPIAQNGHSVTLLNRTDQNQTPASAWRQRGAPIHTAAPVSNSWRSSHPSVPTEPIQQWSLPAPRAQTPAEDEVVFQPPPGVLKQESKAVLKQFWYKDIQGTQHGPFHRRQMKVWYEGDHFPMELLVRVGSDGTFKQMIDHFKAGDALFLDEVPREVVTSSEPVFETIDVEYEAAVEGVHLAGKLEKEDTFHDAIPAKADVRTNIKQSTSVVKQDEAAYDDKVDPPKTAKEQGSKCSEDKVSASTDPLNTKEVEDSALDTTQEFDTVPSASGVMQDPSPVLEVDIANRRNISRDPFTKVKKKKGKKKTVGTTSAASAPAPQPARFIPQRKASPSPPRRQQPARRAVPLNEFAQKPAKTAAPAAAAAPHPSAWSAPKTKVDLMSIMEEEARKAASTKEERMRQQNTMAARIGSAWGTKHQSVPFSSLLQEEAQSSQSIAAPARTAQRPAAPSAWGTVHGSKSGLEQIMAEQRKQPTVAPASGWAAAVSGTTAPLTSSLPVNQPQAQTAKPASSARHRTKSGASSGIASLGNDEDIWGEDTTSSPSVAAVPKPEHDMFGGASMSRALESWCREQMKTLTGNDDITLMRYLMSTPSFEVKEYLEQYLGRSMKVTKFAESFVRQRSFDQGESADGETKSKRKTRRGK